MPIGKIHKWFDERGFGFVKPDSENGDSTFVHISEMHRCGIEEPHVGLALIYEIGEHEGRPIAINVEALMARKAAA